MTLALHLSRVWWRTVLLAGAMVACGCGESGSASRAGANAGASAGTKGLSGDATGATGGTGSGTAGGANSAGGANGSVTGGSVTGGAGQAPVAASNLVVVAPNGNDQAAGTVEAPLKTLQGARDRVRAMGNAVQGDIHIRLRGGTYSLSEGLVLDERDSGRGTASIIWEAYEAEKPVVSGGALVTGFTKDGGSNRYVAPLAYTKKLRSLWVNAQPAFRSRSKAQVHGLNLGTNYAHASDVELTYYGGWGSRHLTVQSIHSGAATMQEPYWTYVAGKDWSPTYGGCESDRPTTSKDYWVENALELADEPGEFYFDREGQKLYYVPRTEAPYAEDVAKLEVIAPLVEPPLLSLKGSSPDKRVVNVKLSGITFSHDNYQLEKVGNSYGYCNCQSLPVMASTPEEGGDPAHWRGMRVANGAVQLEMTENVSIEASRFTHLSSIGLNVLNATKNTLVRGNLFADIASAAISVGHPHHWDTTQDMGWFKPAQVCENTEISHNTLLDRIAIDYPGHPHISVFFVDTCKVENNAIGPNAYSPIEFGWGWEEDLNPPYVRNNSISNNSINGAIFGGGADGGAIYTLGEMPGTVISKNHIFFEGQFWHPEERRYMALYGSGARGLYPDQSSAGQIWSDNVYEGSDDWFFSWWIHPGADVKVDHNFTTSKSANFGYDSGYQATNTQQFQLGSRPAAVQAIVDAAGPAPQYAIKP